MQIYKMKHNQQGTIYSLLTVKDNGKMMMYFHGTDRSTTHEVTENAEGWLCHPGAMFPGLKSGKWVLTTATEEVTSPQTPLIKESGTEIGEPKIKEQKVVVKRQRKPRKKVTAVAPVCRIYEVTELRNDETAEEPKISNKWLRSVGYLAAASVALLVAWESGLIIPLGILGLLTSGVIR